MRLLHSSTKLHLVPDLSPQGTFSIIEWAMHWGVFPLCTMLSVHASLLLAHNWDRVLSLYLQNFLGHSCGKVFCAVSVINHATCPFNVLKTWVSPEVRAPPIIATRAVLSMRMSCDAVVSRYVIEHTAATVDNRA